MLYKNWGGKCVFASELKSDLQSLYRINYPDTPIYGDIRRHILDVPKHDVLCAGFPCQPFSQAGKREGFNDPDRGNLFYDICTIIDQHRPKYILLENVSNLLGHDNGDTWKVIEQKLTDLGYPPRKKSSLLMNLVYPNIGGVYILFVRGQTWVHLSSLSSQREIRK